MNKMEFELRWVGSYVSVTISAWDLEDGRWTVFDDSENLAVSSIFEDWNAKFTSHFDVLNYLIDRECVIIRTQKLDNGYNIQFIDSKNNILKILQSTTQQNDQLPEAIDEGKILTENSIKKLMNIDVQLVMVKVLEHTVSLRIESMYNKYSTNVVIDYQSSNCNESINKLLEEAQSLNLLEYVKFLDLYEDKVDTVNLVKNMIANNLKLKSEDGYTFTFEKIKVPK